MSLAVDSEEDFELEDLQELEVGGDDINNTHPTIYV